MGALAFLHRFGARLNPHGHFHGVVVNGVFEADGAGGARSRTAQGLGSEGLAEIPTEVRVRLLRALARCELLEREDVQAMGAWEHGRSFSLDARVRVEADDRRGLEPLLRYCARPAFALERLREIAHGHRVYESVRPGLEGASA